MSKWNEIMRLHIILPIAETIKGTCAYKWLRTIKQMQSWTPEQVEKWQEDQLQLFIKHAYEHTVYYRRVMDERGLKPEDIRTAEDLKKIPIMTKQIANAHFNEIVPDNLSSFKYRKGKTRDAKS